MKQLAFIACSVIVPFTLFSQAPRTPARQPATKPVTQPDVLKTLADSASYSIGLARAVFFKQQGVTQLNTSLISRGCSEVLQNKPTLLQQEQIGEVMTRFSASVQQQKEKPATGGTAATKPTGAKPAALMATLSDSASYYIGIDIANFYKQHGVVDLNAGLIARAFNDVLQNKPLQLPENMTNPILNKYIIQIQEKLVKATIDAGNAFLVENKKRPGVKTSPSGLQYEVITEGAGVHPTAADSVTCHYKGTFIDGTEFDASYRHGGPITFALRGVIKGWTEGLQYMSEGSKYKFYVPQELAYGAFDRPGIPGGSTLIFEVELIAVKKP